MKPWGYEFQVYDNGRASVWLLNILPRHGTSIHCHYGKRATFVPLVGIIGCRTNDGVKHLQFPQTMTVERYEFHSVFNPIDAGGDAVLLEIERPPDKADLLRLRDDHGRVGRGYEGGDSIVRERLHHYGHFTIAEGGGAVPYGAFVIKVGAASLRVSLGGISTELWL